MKKIACDLNACIRFPLKILIIHLVPPHDGQSNPVVLCIQHFGITDIYFEFTKKYNPINIASSIVIIIILFLFIFCY